MEQTGINFFCTINKAIIRLFVKKNSAIAKSISPFSNCCNQFSVLDIIIWSYIFGCIFNKPSNSCIIYFPMVNTKIKAVGSRNLLHSSSQMKNIMIVRRRSFPASVKYHCLQWYWNSFAPKYFSNIWMCFDTAGGVICGFYKIHGVTNS